MSSIWNAIHTHWRNTLYSNVWISIGAAAWVAQGECVLRHSSNGWLPFFAFCATIFLYNFQRIIKSRYRGAPQASNRVHWMGRNSLFLWLWTVAGGLGLVFCIPNVTWSDILVLVLPGVISVLYIARIFKVGGKTLSGRQLPFVKIWMIALTWAVLGTILPGVHFMGTDFLRDTHTWIWFLEKLLFIVAITIPFDIRDLQYDLEGMKTIPQMLGIRKARFLGVTLLILGLILALILHIEGYYSMHQLMALSVVQVFTSMLVLKSHPDRHETWYVGWLDGTILLQSLAVILATYWNA